MPALRLMRMNYAYGYRTARCFGAATSQHAVQSGAQSEIRVLSAPRSKNHASFAYGKDGFFVRRPVGACRSCKSALSRVGCGLTMGLFLLLLYTSPSRLFVCPGIACAQ